jgi:hypothetical protein
VASVNAANQVAIAGAGGIDVVVAAMRSHTDAAGVQKYGCGALRNLAVNAPANQATIAGAGGLSW